MNQNLLLNYNSFSLRFFDCVLNEHLTIVFPPASVVSMDTQVGSNDTPPVHSEATVVPQKQPSKKRFVILAFLLVFILMILVFFLSLTPFGNPQQQQNSQEISSQQPPVDLRVEYKNPFDKSDQYDNPFENLK